MNEALNRVLIAEQWIAAHVALDPVEPIVQWAVARLWIELGNAAKVLLDLDESGSTDELWLGAYRLRCALAHVPMAKVNHKKVWKTSRERGPVLRETAQRLLDLDKGE